ncbi:DUF4439 domain-containing protein [Rhodococcus sp. X156]|uniref:DUF4439 domain-containing protein n=1 Tax=Rhodococcus sp. X156 TaxID=2499145 RepID=UPI000FDC6C11|nr:DUF4439 domain-containing protein [Rhodococcus sp. X156]
MSTPRTPDAAEQQQALADAVAAEHAAVFAYGVVDAHASPQRQAWVTAVSAAHRARRDATSEALRATGATPPHAAAGYTLPVAVNDPITAAELGVRVETETAVAWRAVLERSAPDASATGLRATAAAALTDCAVRAAYWRAALTTNPVTTAFPGQP